MLKGLDQLDWSVIHSIPIYIEDFQRFSYDDKVISMLSEFVKGLLTWKESMEEKGLRVTCRKDKYHDLWYGHGPPAESGQFPTSHVLFVALEWAAKAVSTGCTRNACSGLKPLAEDLDYRCTLC